MQKHSIGSLWKHMNVRTILTLFSVFIFILGVNSFVLYPLGITYETYPAIHTVWLIFGIILVEKFAPFPIEKLKFSKSGVAAVIFLILAGLITAMPSGGLVARSVKMIEILFQDLVITSTLVTAGSHLSSKYSKVWFSLAFAIMHVPLLFTEPFLHAGTIIAGALVVSYVSISWLQRSKNDITAIIIPHILFYLLFGTALSIVFW